MDVLSEFENRVMKSNGLVCYGAGKRLQLFGLYFMQSPIMNKLIYCVDRNVSLQKTQVDVQGKKINVYPRERLYHDRDKNIVLLITNVRYDEVIEELKAQDNLHGIEYYCFSHILGFLAEKQALDKTVPVPAVSTLNMQIPKIIHYCWFGRNEIPNKYKKWMESWKKYCPDYEIIMWNEDNYDVTKNAYMYEAFQCKKWGFVPDYARLDIIYQYGGIYLDTDVELVQNIDDILFQKAFCGFETNYLVNFGLGFGAIKGLPIIKKLRDDYDNRHFINEDGKMNLISSPYIQTNYLSDCGLKQNGEYQMIEDLTIYPEKMFSAKNVYSRRVRLKEYTKSIHHYEATWLDENSRRFNETFEREMNENGKAVFHGKI